MAYIPSQQINTGSYIQTTGILDVSRLYSVDVNSQEFKELIVRIYQYTNEIAISLNNKDSGYYLNEEFVVGSVYFNPANPSPVALIPVFRKVINFGALPNTATKSVAHGLTPDANWKWRHIYAGATDPVTFKGIPLPYSSATLVNNIELNVDATNVNVITAANYSAYTVCTVVLEYTKQ